MSIREKPAPVTSALTSALMRMAGNSLARHGRGNRVCIVNYHRVLESFDPLLESEPDIATFRWQMALLAECFNVLPLHDAILALEEQRVPPRAVCITFDDGYRSTHDLALPILREFNLPATVFVTTGYLDGSTMWNDRVIEAVRRLSGNSIDLSDIGLGIHPVATAGDRNNAVNKLIAASKYLAPEERFSMAARLEQLAGTPHAPGLMLTREMVASLSQQSVEIGGHTITHPILTSIDDALARHEIAESKRQLEDIIGKPLRLFAYPNGKVDIDFDERHVAMVREAGFTAAFTTAAGATSMRTDRFRIPRCRPWDTTPFMFGLRLLRWLSADAA